MMNISTYSKLLIVESVLADEHKVLGIIKDLDMLEVKKRFGDARGRINN